jgi:sporulation protein YlmC with PRC-barrel domain
MARDKNRARRDRAGVGPDPDRSRRRLISLDDLSGYTIGKGEPDIRGWDVHTVSGRELGEVGDLLVDPERGEVVMLEVALRGDNVHAEVPIRSVQLDRGRKIVMVDSGEVETAHEVRARDRLDPDERDRIRREYAESRRDIRYGEREDHVDRAARTDRAVAADAVDAADRADREDRADRTDRADTDDVEEVVVDRRPVVEEVVVRRRPVE